MSYYIKVMTGFIVLDLYLFLGIAKSEQFWLQVLLVLMFFPLLKGILMITKVSEFKNIGVSFHPKWFKNLTFGFSIGFSFWLLKYGLTFSFGGFDITGVMPIGEAMMSLLLILLTFFIGSLLNDIIVRGYVFGHSKTKIPLKWVFTISVLLYALDDAWYEGFSVTNTVFSLILGLTLTYCIIRQAPYGYYWNTLGT